MILQLLPTQLNYKYKCKYKCKSDANANAIAKPNDTTATKTNTTLKTTTSITTARNKKEQKWNSMYEWEDIVKKKGKDTVNTSMKKLKK